MINTCVAQQAFLAWRATNGLNALTKVDLPSEYFASTSLPSSSSSNCDILRSPDGIFGSCEDEVFWDFYDARGDIVDRKIVASCDRFRRNWNAVMGPLTDPGPRGSLWLVEFNDESGSAKEMILEDYPESKTFHPLGIAIWPSTSGSASNMFVVNHDKDKNTVEQFILDPAQPSTAKYVRTIQSRYLIAPNALALTSPTSFFVSNDHLFTRRLPGLLGKVLPVLETFIGLPTAFIGHLSILHDVPGSAVYRHTIPKLGLPFPNGIALSPDGNTLAVASSSYTWVQFFERSQKNGTEHLSLKHTVSVPFAPDNIHFDASGSLLVAGHPSFPALIAISENKSDAAPSWVVELNPRTEGGTTSSSASFDAKAPFSASRRVRAPSTHALTTLYQGDGTKFAGSTTALRDERTGTLFVTGLFQAGLLICRP